MSKLCQELEGRSWNWTRQLPELLKQVNRHSGAFGLTRQHVVSARQHVVSARQHVVSARQHVISVRQHVVSTRGLDVEATKTPTTSARVLRPANQRARSLHGWLAGWMDRSIDGWMAFQECFW
jgi:HPt (histidine-containing phosphotransfer) domain-containing protein